MKTKTQPLLFCSLLCALVNPVLSQEWRPEMTEKWEPVPNTVIPGEGTLAPSDAIV